MSSVSYRNLFSKAVTSFAGCLWRPAAEGVATLVLLDGLDSFSFSQYRVLQGYIYIYIYL